MHTVPPPTSQASSTASATHARGPGSPDAHTEARRLARLSLLIGRMLAPWTGSLPPEARSELCAEVLAHVAPRLERGEISGPRELLGWVEREARARLPERGPAVSHAAWLERLRRTLPALPPAERDVLQGLYLEGASPARLGIRLGMATAEVDALRRRALETLRRELQLPG